jgi:hypothetical protein
VNANDAALTGLTTNQTGSTVADPAPNAPANPGFDLVLEAAAGSALGSCGARYTLTISAIDPTTARQAWPAQAHRQAPGAASGWELSGPGPDYQCTQAFPVTIPGGAGGPLAATSCSTRPPWSATAPRSSPSSAATHSCSSNPRARPDSSAPPHHGEPATYKQRRVGDIEPGLGCGR